MAKDRRIVVTGVGVVSSVGITVPTFWDSLLAGANGIDRISGFDASGLRCQIAGEIKGLDLSVYMTPKEARRLDPFCHYAVVAADEALAQAGLSADTADPTRVGCLVGGGIGGLRTLQQQAITLHERGPSKSSPLMVPMMIIDMAAGFISIRHGFRGPNLAVVTACASASHAIGEAMWIIKRGDADAMVTGGTEACLCRLGLTGFCAMKALSERNDDPKHASRPFDAERDGFVPSEGAGILVLETLEHARARRAEPLAELVGYGSSADAYHITAPNPDGDGAARAVRMALEHAGMAGSDINYINAHGTSTSLNDRMETAALKTAFGAETARSIAISSTKSMTGHALGAAGGLESIAAIMAMRSGAVPPTINYEYPDPDCDLDYVPNEARELPVRAAMNINLGFGGHNAVLVYKAV